MPLDYRIDHDRQVVFATGRGTLTDQDVFGYQLEVWSRPDVAGYDELVDMTDVEKVALPSGARLQQLAELSASMDEPAARSRLAIVAPEDFAYGLGRMYEAHRGLSAGSTKQVAVFRSWGAALAWLGLPGPLPGAGAGPS
jgi:hypothetical protein